MPLVFSVAHLHAARQQTVVADAVTAVVLSKSVHHLSI
jgi:hypothetical protein